MKKILMLSLLSCLLASCGPVTSGDINNNTVEPAKDPRIGQRVLGRAKNVNDGYIAGASVKIGGKEITKTDEFGAFSYRLSEADLDQSLEVSALGYEPYKTSIAGLKDFDLGELSLDYPYQSFGKTKFKSSDIYNDWTGYATRGLSSLMLKFVSPYQRFINSTSEIHLFVDTGDVKDSFGGGDYQFKLRGDQQLFVYDYGNQNVKTNITQFNYHASLSAIGTELYLEVPYAFLGIDYTEVVGLCFQDVLKSENIVSDFYFNESVITVADPSSFVRIDKKGKAFLNRTNDYDPLWMSDDAKRELSKDYDYDFSGNEYCANSNADHVYFRYEYLENAFKLQFLGFGYFEDNEYFKLSIHSDEYAYYNWALSEEDILIDLRKSGASIYKNLNSFFAVELSHVNPSQQTDVVYHDFDNYFTMDVELPWDLISNVSSNKQGFRFAVVEFGDNEIYSPYDVNNYIRHQGSKVGDIANMPSYIRVISPFDVPTISESDKEAFIDGYHISFGSPKDTLNPESDDLYVKVDRDETSMSFDFIGFGNFQIYENIKIVLHNAEDEAKTDWHINKNDISILINQNRCLIKKNRSWFFDLNCMSAGGNKSTNLPIFSYEQDYFTCHLELTYGDLNEVFATAPIKAVFLEMDFLGNVYNGGLNNKEMRLDGVPTGDPAQQSSYIQIFE